MEKDLLEVFIDDLYTQFKERYQQDEGSLSLLEKGMFLGASLVRLQNLTDRLEKIRDAVWMKLGQAEKLVKDCEAGCYQGEDIEDDVWKLLPIGAENVASRALREPQLALRIYRLRSRLIKLVQEMESDQFIGLAKMAR